MCQALGQVVSLHRPAVPRSSLWFYLIYEETEPQRGLRRCGEWKRPMQVQPHLPLNCRCFPPGRSRWQLVPTWLPHVHSREFDHSLRKTQHQPWAFLPEESRSQHGPPTRHLVCSLLPIKSAKRRPCALFSLLARLSLLIPQ